MPLARVLVVEDSATQAAALALLLEEAGYETVLARRGDKALELLERERIDLVLSDVVMPAMDGYELCRRIKAQDAWRGIPVVLLTSLTDPLAIVRGLVCAFRHVLCCTVVEHRRFLKRRQASLQPSHRASKFQLSSSCNSSKCLTNNW